MSKFAKLNRTEMKKVRGGGYTPIVCETSMRCFSSDGMYEGTCTGEGKTCRCEGPGIPENSTYGCAH